MALRDIVYNMLLYLTRLHAELAPADVTRIQDAASAARSRRGELRGDARQTAQAALSAQRSQPRSLSAGATT